MSQAPIDKKYHNLAEYLALEDKAKTKHEYHDGEIVAMSGASFNHNIITSNLMGLLYNALAQSSCRAFGSDLRVQIEQSNTFTYPDVLVICGEPKFYKDRTDTITNPVVLFEVLSPSTQKIDSSDKLEKYCSVETVQNYVLIDQKRDLVKNYQRVEEGRWLLELYNNQNSSLHLLAIQTEFALTQIYNGVLFKNQMR